MYIIITHQIFLVRDNDNNLDETYSLELLVLDFSTFFIRFNIFDLPWCIIFDVMLKLSLDFLGTWFSIILNA